MGQRSIYLAGPITGVTNYWKLFEVAEDELQSKGYVVLNPAVLPVGLSYEQYTQIDLAMLMAADAVLFLPGWPRSRGACMEMQVCQYIQKPYAESITKLEEVLNG